MFIFDQHIHCSASPDSSTPMRAMAEAARDHGMHMVCFTDHVDMDDASTGEVAPYWPDCWDGMLAQWQALRADPVEGIEVRFGMELGEPHHCPEVAREAAARPELDLVLGSLHNLRHTPDFYFYPYTSEEECDMLNRAYLAELLEMTEYDCFDVMAHIGYTHRYMSRRGFAAQVTPDLYREELTELFRALIRQGRGIEINASGLRQGITSFPNAPCLALYRELGGEIVSVGSDAHTAPDAGVGIREAIELLRGLGFRYVTEYKKRKPSFVKL